MAEEKSARVTARRPATVAKPPAPRTATSAITPATVEQPFDFEQELKSRDRHISKLVEKNEQLEAQLKALSEGKEAEIAERAAAQAVRYAKSTEELMSQLVHLRAQLQEHMPFAPIATDPGLAPAPVGDPSDNYREDRE